jgi:hypothetical protein
MEDMMGGRAGWGDLVSVDERRLQHRVGEVEVELLRREGSVMVVRLVRGWSEDGHLQLERERSG